MRRWEIATVALCLVVLIAPAGLGNLSSNSPTSAAAPAAPVGHFPKSPMSRVSGPSEPNGLRTICRMGGPVPCGSNLPTAPPAPELGVWLNLTSTLGQPEAPTPTAIRDWGATLAYDAKDGYFVFYSDTAASDYPTNTWIFDHGSWSEDRNLPQPPSGGGDSAEMVYDASDGYVVLFEGAPPFIQTPVTWVYSAGTWSNVTSMSPTMPAARTANSLAYDAASGEVVLFGGDCWYFTICRDQPLNDTWTFHAGIWRNVTNRSTAQPSQRVAAALLPIGADGVLLFGGWEGGGASLLNDSWQFTNGSWRNVTNASQPRPSARAEAVTADIGPSSTPALFGGIDSGGNLANDTWTYDHGAWANVSSSLGGDGPASVPRAGGASNPYACCLAYDAEDNFTLLLEATANYSNWNGYAYSLGPSALFFYRLSRPAIDLGQTFTLNATSIPSGANLSFATPPGCLSPSLGNLSCTPTVTGPFEVNLSATGSGGLQASRRVVVQVNPDPRISSFVLDPPVVTIGNSTRLVATAVNGTPPFTFGFVGYPTGCGSYNAPAVNCTPGVTGSFRITAWANDAVGDEAYSNATLVVEPRPVARPLLISPSLIDLGASVLIVANLSGGSPPFTFDYTGLPSGCLTKDSANFTCVPAGAGNFTVIDTVSDAFGWTTTSAGSLTVLPALSLTEFSAAPTIAEVGVGVTLRASASGGDAPYNFVVAGFPGPCPWGGQTTVTCYANASGNFTLVLTATDLLGVTVTASQALRVAPALQVVAFSFAPNRTDVGQSSTATVLLSGGVAPVTATFQNPLGVGATCTHEALSDRCLWDAAANATLLVSLVDSIGGTAHASATVEVRPPPSVSTLSVTPNAVNQGSAATFSVGATGGVPPYSFTWSGLPPGCTAGNLTSFRCAPSGAGSFTVEVTVTDAAGGNGSLSASLTVVPTIFGVPDLYLVGALGVGAAVAAVVWILRRRRRAEGEQASASARR